MTERGPETPIWGLVGFLLGETVERRGDANADIEPLDRLARRLQGVRAVGRLDPGIVEQAAPV